jgi:hypothetical protein
VARRRCCAAEGEAEEEEGGAGADVQFQKFQGRRCKTRFFSQFYISNEKMVKIRTVEPFKTYNLDLGFKFKNSKDRALF